MSGLRSNLCLRAMIAVLDDHGVPYRVRYGGKHPQIVFNLRGRTRSRAFPASPSDYRSHLNARSQMKRLVRKIEESV